MFVKIKDDNDFSERRVGRIVEDNNDISVVEFFDNPVDPPEQLEVPRDNFIFRKIPYGSRIFYFHEKANSWFVGKLLDNETSFNGYTKNCKIKFETALLPEDLDQELILKPNKVFTRHYIPLTNPALFLQSKITETKQYFENRSQYQQCLINYRAISKGVDSIFSANINLEEHQVDIATRVLQDPIQRYILGDEVGLGKTIEAAIIIRQFVLDFPTSHRVLIVCPKELKTQWRHELALRFNLLKSLDRGFIRIYSYEQVEEITPVLRKRGINQVDMIVVDEAHNLNRKNHRELFNKIKFHGQKINRFLLLSGTPVLNNELAFLEMLELLDPDIYDISDLKLFKKRIASRQRISEIINILNPVAKLVMKEDVEQLVSMFPNDEKLRTYVANLVPILNDFSISEEDPTFVEQLGILREYVAETFKIDRRMLRTRRQNVSGLTPPREGVEVSTVRSSDAENLYSLLEEIRNLGNSLPSKKAQEDLEEVFFDLVSLYIQGSVSTVFAQRRLIMLNRVIHKNRFYKETNKVLIKLYEKTESFLRNLVNRKLNQKFEKVLDLVSSDKMQKIIIFCTDEELAKGLKTFLNRELEDAYIFHGEDSTVINKRFETYEQKIVAIFDRHSEEGLNLQGEKRSIIHLDLPLNPNRIEQRIGRVDRYGGSSFNNFLIVDESNPYEIEWKRLVVDTIKVFDRSIASLQLLLEKQLEIMKSFFFQQGLHAFSEMSNRLGGEDGLIDKSLRDILMQENLDSIQVPFYEDFNSVKRFDADIKNIKKPVINWVDTLRLQVLPNPKGQDTVFKFYRTDYCRIALDNYVENLVEKENQAYEEGNWRRYPSKDHTFSREKALETVKNVKLISLIRPGDPYFLGLDLLTENDDRGRVFGSVREINQSIATKVYLCFEFKVEVDIEELVEILVQRNKQMKIEKKKSVFLAMKRFSDGFLSPKIFKIWVNQEENVENDSKVINILNQPYSKEKSSDDEIGLHYRDRNLNYKNWVFVKRNNFPRLDNWEQFVNNSTSIAKAYVRNIDQLKNDISAGQKSLSKYLKQKLSQLENRLNFVGEGAGGAETEFRQSDLERYRVIDEFLIKGISEPLVQLEGCGVMFLRKLPNQA